MAEHLHRAYRYKTVGKQDCAYVQCRCGAWKAVAIWYNRNTPPGVHWDPVHWRLHGYRKMVACDQRWRKHIRRLHRAWHRRDARKEKTP